MAMKGIVTGTFIGPNKNGLENVRMLWVSISEPTDIQPVQYVSQSGDDTAPQVGDEVTIVQISESFKIAIASDDLITPTMLPGEKKTYSFLSGTIKAFINYLITGILELNGNNDYAVRFNELQTAFNELKLSHNTLVALYNLHEHVLDVPNNKTLITANQTTPSVANIEPAKVLEVKIKGLGEV